MNRSRVLVSGLLSALFLGACGHPLPPASTSPDRGLTLSALPSPPTTAAGQAATLGFTVTNTGTLARRGVTLTGVLDVPSDTYSATLPDGAQANGKQGFTVSLDLAPGQARTVTFQGQASATGVYCTAATITAGGTLSAQLLAPGRNATLNAQTCLRVGEAQLGVTRRVLGSGADVPAGQAVQIEVRVVNRGALEAREVTLTDGFTSGPARYAITDVTPPAGVTLRSEILGPGPRSAFDTAPVTLRPDQTLTYVVTVNPGGPGRYCGTATARGDAAVKAVATAACFTVASTP